MDERQKEAVLTTAGLRRLNSKNYSCLATRTSGVCRDRVYTSSSYSFSTLELDDGEWSSPCPGRALPPGK
jgi:hypothetical protein